MKNILFIIIIGFISCDLYSISTAEQLQNSVIWTTGTGKTAVFRKAFNVPSDKDTAQISIFADSYYALYINGNYVMSGPSRFDPKLPEYDRFDISSFLVKGNNTVAVLVYGGISNGMRMNHAPGLTLAISGKDFSVQTDNTWKCSENTRFRQPVSKWNGIDETINASSQTADCLAADFDDSSWGTSIVIDGKQWGTFRPRSIPLLLQKEIKCKPLSLPLTVSQSLSVKFDRNYLLTADLEFEAAEPCEVKIGGTKYIANKGTHRFRTYDPFGITDAALTITTTKPVTLKNIRFFNPVYPFELKGSFVSSDTILNRLWGMSIHTLQQVSEDGYQDCPWERAEWMGDAAIIEYPLTRAVFVSTDGVYSDPRLIRKMIRDIAQSADNTGRIKAHHPSDRFDIHAYIEDYSCIWVQSLREYYEYSGDSAFVREMWPVLTNLMKWFLNQKAASGLINAREFIIFDNPIKYKTCEGATVNAFTYKALIDAAFLAGAIGDKTNAASYNQAATDLRTAFNKVLWNSSAQLFNASTVDQPSFHSALLTLDRGIVDDDKKPLVAGWLLDNYSDASKALMTYTHFWLFKFLYLQDTEEWDKKAQDLIKARYEKFYSYANIGYTVAESFGGDRPFHNFGSSAAFFMSANILGVSIGLPLSANQLIIKPQLGYLTKAEGTVVTEHGLVEVKWEKITANSRFKFKFSIPGGKKAKVYLPVPVVGPQLSINGKQYKYIVDGRYAVVELEGGTYEGELMPAFKVESGQVPRNNGKIVVVKCSANVQSNSSITGFTLKNKDSISIALDSAKYSISEQAVVLYLASSITKDDELFLSYSNGNVLSVEQQELLEFSDFCIDNLLPGAAPMLSSATIPKNGDEIVLLFKKNMITENISNTAFKFTETSANKQLIINAVKPLLGDSTGIVIIPSEKLFLENKLVLSYSDVTVMSSDKAKLGQIDNFVVRNNANGLPPKITSANVAFDGWSVKLVFSKELIPDQSLGKIFEIKINNSAVVIESLSFNSGRITMTLNEPVRAGDTVMLNMEGGKLLSIDNGVSEKISNYQVTNSLPPINYLPVPGKLEAEMCISQFGTETENTSDVGGGKNVGWIDASDWLEFAVNVADSGSYNVEYRVAGLYNASIILQQRGKTVTELCNTAINSTGGWQTWTTVKGKLKLKAGKQIIRTHFPSGGFNLNWINFVKESIVKVPSTLTEPGLQGFIVYPNPSSGMLCIETREFKYSNISILNLEGKLMTNQIVNYEPVKQLTLNLPNGAYTIVLSNNKESRSKMFVINQF